MMKRMAVVLCLILVLSLFPIPAFAFSDVTPPEVSGLSADKAVYRVGDTITVNVTASDRETGLSPDGATLLIHHAQSPYNHICFRLNSINAGSDGTGIYSFVFDVTSLATNGEYQLEYLVLMDKGGNCARFSTPDKLPAFSLSIDNPDRMDCTAPTLESVTFSPDKGLKPGDTVHMTVKAHDESGIERCCIWPGTSTVFYYGQPAVLLPTGDDTLEGDFIIDPSMKSENWKVSTIQVFDKVNNVLLLRANEYDFPSFEVINDSAPILPPLISDIQLSSLETTVGEKIKFTVLVDPRGNPMGNGMYLYVRHALSQDWGAGPCVTLSKVEEGRYEGIWQTSPQNPYGEYFVNSIVAFDVSNNYLNTIISPSLYHKYEGQSLERLQRFTINSVFSGVDNKVLAVGDSFDPMSGISAGSSLEGDMTPEITVDGTVDTSKPGMYLLRYRVQGAVEVWNSYTGKSELVTYMDFRWIGVSELPAPEGQAAEAPADILTDDAVDIVLPDASVQVDVQKDGAQIPYQQSNAGEGLYRATLNQGSMTAGAPALASIAAPQKSPGAGQGGKSMTALVDRQGPAIEYTVGSNASSMILNVKAKDASGIRELKWLPGWVTIADFADRGTVFTDTMPITASGKYTVFASDRFGNKAIKQVQAVKTKSNYLWGISLSAGKFSRAFNSKITSYTVTLGEKDGSVTVTPFKAYNNAVMTIDGKNAARKTVKLANGKSAGMTVKVTWNKKTTTYRLKIIRSKSTNNRLSKLTASAGTWSAAFSPSITNYKLTLPEKVSKVTLTAKKASSLASVAPAGKTYALKRGQSVKATFKVKAQSGAIRTYTVTIKRK